MKTLFAPFASRLSVLVLLSIAPLESTAQEISRATYRLLEGSTLTDDCPICARPTILYAVRGSFELVRESANPLVTTYSVTNIQITTSGIAPDTHRLTGHGTFIIGGEVAVQQQMALQLSFDGKAVGFTNGPVVTDKLFPLISIELNQTNPTLLQTLTLNLVAAPARDIWFSTVSGFTPAAGKFHGTGGDVLSVDGHVVAGASNLVALLDLPASAPPVNIDALALRPGGEIWFSMRESQPVTRIGPIYQGDLVSNSGRLIRKNQELTSAFGIMPVVPDVGLDAVAVRDDGEILFSTTTDIFGERAGRLLRHGDLLSNRGVIVANNAQLLARFHPPTGADFGLDALYLWPSGEIWFSVEKGFQDGELGPIGDGDLLSNQGIIVHRNLELMSAFAPLEDLADFGLDALFVVSDVRESTTRPRITRIVGANHSIHLEWQGSGQVFQVVRAERVDGTFEPISPPLPTLSFDDGATDGRGFYQVRQW